MAHLVNVYLSCNPADDHIEDICLSDQGKDGFRNYIQRRCRELALCNYPNPVAFVHRRIDPEMVEWLNLKNDLLFQKTDTLVYVASRIVNPDEFYHVSYENKFETDFNFDGRYILVNNSGDYSLDFLRDYDFIPSFGSNWKDLESDLNKEVPVYLDNRLVFSLNDYTRAHFFDKTLYKPIPVQQFREHKQKQEAIDFWRVTNNNVKDIPSNRLSWSIVSALAKASPGNIKNLPPEKVPGEILDAAVKIDGSILIDYPDKNALTEERVINAIKSKSDGSGILLQHLPDDRKSDRLCLAAVSSDGNALEFVPEKFRTEELCRKALANAWSFYGGHVELLSIIPHPELWLNEYMSSPELVDKMKPPQEMENFNIYTVYREIEKKMREDGAEPLSFNQMKEAWNTGALEIDDRYSSNCFNITINREDKNLTITTSLAENESYVQEEEMARQTKNTL